MLLSVLSLLKIQMFWHVMIRIVLRKIPWHVHTFMSISLMLFALDVNVVSFARQNTFDHCA